jgi:hypothetical protein
MRPAPVGIALACTCGVTVHTGTPVGAGPRGIGAGVADGGFGVTDQMGVPAGTPVGGSGAGESVPDGTSGHDVNCGGGSGLGAINVGSGG